MTGLDTEIRQCKTVRQCVDLASVDCYNEDELATSWLTCLEEVFPRGTPIRVLELDAVVQRLDLLEDRGVITVCRRGQRVAHVALVTADFPTLTPIQRLWLRAFRSVSGELRAPGARVCLEAKPAFARRWIRIDQEE